MEIVTLASIEVFIIIMRALLMPIFKKVLIPRHPLTFFLLQAFDSSLFLDRKAATTKSTINMEDAKKPDITLYSARTPNGIKISIALEELG